jgi:hypothetical protein
VKTLLLGLTILYGAAYWALPSMTPPEPIKVTPLTPEQIDQQVQKERKQIEYDAAENIAAVVMRRNGCSDEFAEAVGQSAVDNGVSPRVLASLTFVESSCKADAVSDRNSVGLTQVNPRVWKFSKVELMDPYRNAQIGGRILAEYVHKYGLKEGLHHYNGLGDETDEYSTKVLLCAGYKVPS